jgi:hypothetical protein
VSTETDGARTVGPVDLPTAVALVVSTTALLGFLDPVSGVETGHAVGALVGASVLGYFAYWTVRGPWR